MIHYDHRFWSVCSLSGSVFPAACMWSLPSSIFSCILVTAIQNWNADWQWKPLQSLKDENAIISNSALWGGFTSLVGFLLVFRTSQAYSRFWEGATHAHKMGGEWFDACSSLMAYTKHSDQSKEKILRFQNTLVRLFSMLHAAAWGEIEDTDDDTDYAKCMAYNTDLIDPIALGADTLNIIRDCNAKVDLIFQWIQQLVVVNIKTQVLSIPPPILSRSFQELANGMVHFHEAMKISTVPFPFPYAQTCVFLLCLHSLFVPFIVCTWVTEPLWAFPFCFMQVFTLWCLNLIADEIENPFGTDTNDIDGAEQQLAMNNSLRLLLLADSFTLPAADGPNQRDIMARAISEAHLPDECCSFYLAWKRFEPATGKRDSVKNFRSQKDKRKNPHETTALFKMTLSNVGEACGDGSQSFGEKTTLNSQIVDAPHIRAETKEWYNNRDGVPEMELTLNSTSTAPPSHHGTGQSESSENGVSKELHDAARLAHCSSLRSATSASPPAQQPSFEDGDTHRSRSGERVPAIRLGAYTEAGSPDRQVKFSSPRSPRVVTHATHPPAYQPSLENDGNQMSDDRSLATRSGTYTEAVEAVSSNRQVNVVKRRNDELPTARQFPLGSPAGRVRAL